MTRNHLQEWAECQEKRDENRSKATKDDKNDPKQRSIKEYVAKSTVGSLCLDIVVSNAIPFSVFDTPGLKTLVKHAASHLNEKIVINSSNMKALVLKEATNMKKKIAGMLANRFVNFQIDMATCQAQSFFGKITFANT